jgi:uncharacterized protein YjbI with pentapeptide repeats
MAAQDNSPDPDSAVNGEVDELEFGKRRVAELEALASPSATGRQPPIWRPLRRYQNHRNGKAAQEKAAKAARRRWPLWVLVAGGTLVVTVIGFGFFGWLTWLLSHQPWPWRDPDGWRAFFSHVDGTEMFDAARTTATILAIIGIGGAALVAYRRQDTAERAHEVAIEAQQTATEQLRLDSRKYELDRQRHELETDKHKLDNDRRADDRERELRARFTTIAEQLGSDNYAVRHAGAYALASLADDWHNFGKDNERQVCVNLLCAQLRTPRPQVQFYDDNNVPEDTGDSPEDLEVRKTIVDQIRLHRSSKIEDPDDWRPCRLDLAGADLSGFNFNETDLQGANLDGADLSRATLVAANLTGASLVRAMLDATDFTAANLTKAELQSSRTKAVSNSARNRVVFQNAILQGSWFTDASLPHADFERASLSGAKLTNADLVMATFTKAQLIDANCANAKFMKASFKDADVRGADFSTAVIADANFRGARHSGKTRWPDGAVPEFLQGRKARGVDDPPEPPVPQ